MRNWVTFFAVYGVTAMLAYFPGGLIADRVSARVLITTSLLATAAGDVVMASTPGRAVLTALFAYWGVTTIFLFWAAIIRATREWGGARAQGAAFGFPRRRSWAHRRGASQHRRAAVRPRAARGQWGARPGPTP